jgi:pyridoxine/pyridoxamine 5'-phosphate oxidase
MSAEIFDEAYAYCEQKLAACRVASLATCGKDLRVSSRSMSVVYVEGALWFQTDVRFRKARQIAENPFVALSFDNIQVEGRAELIGRADDPRCSDFVQRFKQIHPGSFNAYTRLEEERVYRVSMLRLIAWRYADGKAFINSLDVAHRKVERRFYPEA